MENATTADYLNFDRLYKVRPLLPSIASKFNRIEPEEYNSADEQVIPTKCRSILKTYNQKKPNKWSYKVFSRCGATGIVYNFQGVLHLFME